MQDADEVYRQSEEVLRKDAAQWLGNRPFMQTAFTRRQTSA